MSEDLGSEHSLKKTSPIAIVNVGLPARGKTHTSLAIVRYLSWMGIKCDTFNVGITRRRLYGSQTMYELVSKSDDSKELREFLYNECLQELADFLLKQKGQVAIYDGANLSRATREDVKTKLEGLGIQPVFIEYICEKEAVIEANIRKVKINSPDYEKMSEEDAINDFKLKVKSFEPEYETITDKSLQYIKLINSGDRIETNNISGYLMTRLVFYLMNIHTLNRVIYLARCGEEVSGVSLKADPNLSEAGKEYSEKLYASIMKRIKERNRGYEARSDGVILKVWCSSQVKCIQTAEPFLDKDGVVVRRRMMLRGRDEGVVLGMTPNEIKEKYPEEYDKHIIDPYNYSFPRAESYFDLSLRLEAVILSLEREENDILIIAPESVLRCVYAYFTPGILPKRVIPTLKFPRSVLVELTPTAYGCIEKKIPITDA